MSENRQHSSPDASASLSASDSAWADLRHTVSELIRVLLLRKWFFVVPFFVALIGALLYSHRIPRVYRASTVFERRPDLATMKLARAGSPQEFNSILRSFAFDVVDPEALCEVVETLGWARELPRGADGELTPEGEKRRLKMVESYQEGVSFEMLTRNEELDIIELRYTGDDPEEARLLVEEIRDTYIRRTRLRIMKILEDARSYFTRKLQDSREQGDRLAEELLRFQIQYPGVNPDDPNSIAQKLNILENRRESLSQRNWSLDTDIASREAFLNETPLDKSSAQSERDATEPEALVPNPRRADLQRHIRQLESEIADLQLTRHMTAKHPEITSKRRAMQMAAAELAQSPELVPRRSAVVLPRKNAVGTTGDDELWKPQKARVELELTSLRQSKSRARQNLDGVTEQIASLEQMQDDIFDKRREYNLLAGEATASAIETARWRSQVEEINGIIDVESRQQGMGFSVVVPAARIPRPISPRFWTVITLSLMFAGCLGIATVLVAELLDRKVRTAGQIVRATGLPILDAIDEILTPAERRSRFIGAVVVKPAVVMCMLLLAAVTLLTAYASIEDPVLLERIKVKPGLHWITGVEESKGSGIA